MVFAEAYCLDRLPKKLARRLLEREAVLLRGRKLADPTTIIVGGLVAYASKDLIAKVLGPTADYVGNETKDLVEASARNLKAIFRSAYKKLSALGVDEANAVNLRVLKEVLSEGRFVDHEVTQSYFAGVLCSAKTDPSADDRGVFYISIIKKLSSYQVTLHYIAYLALSAALRSKDIDYFEKIKNRSSLKVYIPSDLLFDAFGITSKSDFYTKTEHSLSGLSDSSLIGPGAGLVDGIKEGRFDAIGGSGVVLTPTLLGADCFLWANGVSNMPGSRLGHANIPEDLKLVDVSSVIVTFES